MSDEIKGGCVTSYGAVSGTITMPAYPNIAFSNGRYGVLLTINSEGRMEVGPGLSREAATQAVAKMLVDQWGRIYGQKLRIAEEAIEKANVKARRMESEMLAWKKAALRAGVNPKKVDGVKDISREEGGDEERADG